MKRFARIITDNQLIIINTDHITGLSTDYDGTWTLGMINGDTYTIDNETAEEIIGMITEDQE